ncbi:GNAT family N-acetyltransferase [Streptomyces cinnamoneus]|uniref:GNAT family N-acetyltransferase n=1 Tax=Streptomyces cinnamoneus TaxID=53446 RepID=A0A2G1XG59_STRCJ|nr:GNAT family N-acetyltransferase [Streptomyces cinnamoneus]PHQ50223.1 GNAT family N-acetyltransferase [Streptomyces cinnamoneus]PPT12993.1 N-acetyltransferase [Streptomyces cinnamoneus]
MTGSAPSWTIAPQPVGSPESAALLRAFLVDVADRWYLLHRGSRTTPEEVERHLAEMPSDDLAPPHGVFLMGRHGGAPAGCVGLRRLDGRTAELTRMFVRASLRGTGGAAALVGAAEAVAREWGARRVVLETRRDLREARALYARHGFTEIAPYKTGDEYAEVWLGKELD